LATALACDPRLHLERDIFRATDGSPIDADISFASKRCDVAAVVSVDPPGRELDREALRRVRMEADRLRRQMS
jgi:hypothetical protein